MRYPFAGKGDHDDGTLQNARLRYVRGRLSPVFVRQSDGSVICEPDEMLVSVFCPSSVRAVAHQMEQNAARLQPLASVCGNRRDSTGGTLRMTARYST